MRHREDCAQLWGGVCECELSAPVVRARIAQQLRAEAFKQQGWFDQEVRAAYERAALIALDPTHATNAAAREAAYVRAFAAALGMCEPNDDHTEVDGVAWCDAHGSTYEHADGACRWLLERVARALAEVAGLR